MLRRRQYGHVSEGWKSLLVFISCSSFFFRGYDTTSAREVNNLCGRDMSDCGPMSEARRGQDAVQSGVSAGPALKEAGPIIKEEGDVCAHAR